MGEYLGGDSGADRERFTITFTRGIGNGFVRVFRVYCDIMIALKMQRIFLGVDQGADREQIAEPLIVSEVIPSQIRSR